MEKIDKKIFEQIFKSISAEMDSAKEELIELDGAMGDGDLGLTMSNGFQAVAAECEAQAETDIGKLFMKLGMKMNSTVPSTMGTLISTCLMKAGPAAKGKTEIALSDLAAMGEGALNGVMERGGAKPGDKTMLDALAPAVEALKQAAAEGKDITAGAEAAAAAAEKGAEGTKELQSVHGRAAYYREKSVGRQDPGATAMAHIMRGFANGVKA